MANFGLSDLDFVLYNGSDITGTVLGLSDEIVNEVEDRTAAGNEVATSAFIGRQSSTVDISAFYDSLVTAALEANPAAGAQNVLMYALEGNTVGNNVACLATALKTHYQKSSEAAGLHKVAIAFAGADSAFTIDQALLVGILASRGAAGDTHLTYVDAGAQTTGGGRWYVSLPALTLGGYTNLIVKLQDCATAGGTYADVSGATLTFTAAGAKMAAFSGTVRRYQCVAWAPTGSGSGLAETFAAGLTKLP
jgi:hypothetical protein